MFDVFTILLGTVSLCVAAAAALKIFMTPKKDWEDEEWMFEQIEEKTDFDQLRKTNPHIWM